MQNCPSTWNIGLLTDNDEAVLRPASAFYDRYHPVFKEMLEATRSSNGETKNFFPASPFSDFKWIDFMRLAGMQCDVTNDMFIKFATELANEARTGM